MKIYLTGTTLDWFNNHEYFSKILKVVWIEHDDVHMSEFNNRYTPLLIKKIMNPGSIFYYNNKVLFISCLNDDLVINSNSFLKGLTSLLSEFADNNETINIELIIPNDKSLNKNSEESILKSIIFSQFKQNLYVKSMEKIEESLLIYS